MWAAGGIVISLFTAFFAVFRSMRNAENYYSAQVYGMTPAAHRAYAAVSGVFALAFIAAFFITAIPTVPLLAIYALVAIFYFSSFARGFSDEP